MVWTQTTKEDNIALLDDMRHVLSERNEMLQHFRELKEQHQDTREQMAASMAR